MERLRDHGIVLIIGIEVPGYDCFEGLGGHEIVLFVGIKGPE